MSANGSYKEKLWQRIEQLAKAEGLELFDIETPSDAGGARGFVRVFITRIARPAEASAGDESGGGHIAAAASVKNPLTVDVSDCARLSKRILDLPDVEELIPGECQLEVSSPGINRKLSREDHFSGAVGERVRVVVRRQGIEPVRKEVLRGKLLSFNGRELEIEEEERKAKQLIAISDVAEARVDFKF